MRQAGTFITDIMGCMIIAESPEVAAVANGAMTVLVGLGSANCMQMAQKNFLRPFRICIEHEH